jgi:hypothetical protein
MAQATAPLFDSTVCHERRPSTTVRNCTRDEGGPFEVGSQVQTSTYRVKSHGSVVSRRRESAMLYER